MNTSPLISLGPTPPADTTALWLSTSHRDMRISQNPGDRSVALAPTLSWEGAVLQEPTVWYYNGKYHMIYSGGNSGSTYLGYAYATNLQGPWTKNPAPILGHSTGNGSPAGDAFHSSVYIEGTTGYLYVPDTGTGGQWKVWTFALTDPTTLTAGGVCFVAPTGVSGTQGNSAVIKDSDGTYIFMYEASWNNYQHGYATGTSPSGPFTNVDLPLATLRPTFYANNNTNLAIQHGGPCLFKEDNTYILYYHGGANGRPTQGYRAFSTDVINWTIDNGGLPYIRRAAFYEVDQVADLDVVQANNNGPWYCFWSAMQNTPNLVGRIMMAPMQPVLKQFDGYQWVPLLHSTDTSAPKTEFISNFVATSNFTTSTVGSDVAVTGLSLTYTPPFTARAQVRMRVKVSSSVAGSVLAKIAVTPTTVINSAPNVEYPTVTSQRDDMPGDSTKFTTLHVSTTVDLIPGTTYTFTGYVNNVATGATTTVAFGGTVSEIELLAIPN